MNFSEIVNNNLYFSVLLGLIVSAVVFYLIRSENENESKMKRHLKIALSASAIFWVGMFIKSKNIMSGGGNSSSNTLKIDDLNLDDPFN